MDFFSSSGWADFVKELCRLMVKLTGFFLGVITVLLSDPVILLAVVDLSYFILG